MATTKKTEDTDSFEEKQKLVEEREAYLKDWEENLVGREKELQKREQQRGKARFSMNTSFLLSGFRMQLTVADQSLNDLTREFDEVMRYLEAKGAVPETKVIRASNDGAKTINGNGETERKCVACGSTNLHFIGTSQVGKVIDRWVCDDCHKWQPK
jgi:predicted dithiol-disulfide oxidoreductase (DUF899 family)